MQLGEAMDTVISKGEDAYWFRPREWSGTGNAFSLSMESDLVMLMLPGIGAVEGISSSVVKTTEAWDVVSIEMVQREYARVVDDTGEGIPRQQIEQVAATMGPDSAAALALAEADKLRARGEQAVFLRFGDDLVVGPSLG